MKTSRKKKISLCVISCLVLTACAVGGKMMLNPNRLSRKGL